LAGVNFKNLKKVKLSGSSSVAIKSGLKWKKPPREI
jgi:hypothetical protein